MTAGTDLASGNDTVESRRSMQATGSDLHRTSTSSPLTNLPQRNQSIRSVRFEAVADGLSTDDEAGLIEPLFQIPREISAPQSSASDAPWQLESETLERLRKLAKRSFADWSRASDLVITEWFSERGGLIRLAASGSPLLAPMPTTPLIDVGLDAAIGIHRSFELIAAGRGEAISQSLQESILTALMGADDSQVQSSSDKHPALRLSAWMFPGLAAAASSLAWAASRKRWLGSSAASRLKMCERKGVRNQ